MKTAFVINGKIKKFPSLLSPESLDDTAFGAVSSKLADYSGGELGIRTLGSFWEHSIIKAVLLEILVIQ